MIRVNFSARIAAMPRRRQKIAVRRMYEGRIAKMVAEGRIRGGKVGRVRVQGGEFTLNITLQPLVPVDKIVVSPRRAGRNTLVSQIYARRPA